jgi:hypothetical protein
MVISANQASSPRARQGAVGNQTLPSLPEQSGSFVPPAASANLRHRNDELFEIAGCFRCGGSHHEIVCQQRDPWEYIAPFYGSADFGQGFFSIPVVETDAHPVEQMNYAHTLLKLEKSLVEILNMNLMSGLTRCRSTGGSLPRLCLPLNLEPDFPMLNLLMSLLILASFS